MASVAKQPLELRDGLPFVSVELTFRGRSIEIAGVLVDTGAARTIDLRRLTLDFAYD